MSPEVVPAVLVAAPARRPSADEQQTALEVLLRDVALHLADALRHGRIAGVLGAARQAEHLVGYDPTLTTAAFARVCRELPPCV